MKHLRITTLTLACAAALAATSAVQAQAPGFRTSGSRGITDIVRGAVTAPPPVPANRPPAGPAVQRSAEYIVALVNSEPITNTDVQSRVERIVRENEAEAAKIPRAELARNARIFRQRQKNGRRREPLALDDDRAVVQRRRRIKDRHQQIVADLRVERNARVDEIP